MMYYYEKNKNRWSILDPDGDWVCNVDSLSEAKILCSHLNRAGY